jgi:hypothetical protein
VSPTPPPAAKTRDVSFFFSVFFFPPIFSLPLRRRPRRTQTRAVRERSRKLVLPGASNMRVEAPFSTWPTVRSHPTSHTVLPSPRATSHDSAHPVLDAAPPVPPRTTTCSSQVSACWCLARALCRRISLEFGAPSEDIITDGAGGFTALPVSMCQRNHVSAPTRAAPFTPLRETAGTGPGGLVVSQSLESVLPVSRQRRRPGCRNVLTNDANVAT